MAREFCREFFPFYNNEHYHSGIGLLTPVSVHYQTAKGVILEREKVLEQAFDKHPERFTQKIPEPDKLPKAVWINAPKEQDV